MKLSRQIEKPFVSFFFHQCSEHVSSYDIACIYVATLSQILVMVGVSFKLQKIFILKIFHWMINLSINAYRSFKYLLLKNEIVRI